MRGDVPDDREPDTRDEDPDAAAWSIEDFDDFEPIPEILEDENAAPVADQTAAPGEDHSAATADQDTEEFEPFQPGFAFEDGLDAESPTGGTDPSWAGASEEEEPGFAELWASTTGGEAEPVDAPADLTASADDADQEGAGRDEDGDEGAPADEDATAEFVPHGVATGEPDGTAQAEEEGAEEVSAAAAAPMAVTAAASPPYDHEAAAAERLDEITAERLYSTSTQEYAGLAEHVARAADEDQELMAVAADMPGLERDIVGLDDVVQATGVEDTPTVARRSSDLPLRIGTAALLLAVFIGSLYRPLFLGLLALLVLGLAAGEFYTVLVRSGFHPLTVFGLAGVAGAMIGTWIYGPVAIPMSMAAALLLVLIFYTVVSGRSLPLFNAALTMMVAVWIGLGAFVFDMVQSPNFRWLIVAFIVTVAFMDIAQYFIGRRLGRTPLAPRISPKKTVEGLAGGILGAVFVGVSFGLFESGPFDLGSGLLLGLLVASVAPFGDLAISVVKRALNVKDMGTILPGHGGVLDRIDAMLVVVPVVWVAYSWLGLLN